MYKRIIQIRIRNWWNTCNHLLNLIISVENWMNSSKHYYLIQRIKNQIMLGRFLTLLKVEIKTV